MKENLEDISLDYENSIVEGGCTTPKKTYSKNPILNYFISKIRNKRRRKEIEKDTSRIFNNYMEDLKRNSPAPRRAYLIEQANNMLPENENLEGRDAQEVLKQRIYSRPGRHYPYLNNLSKSNSKASEIKKELGRAAKYTIKEGWPVIGAGTGWWLTNNWYNNQMKLGSNFITRNIADYKGGLARVTNEALKELKGSKGIFGKGRYLLKGIGRVADYMGPVTQAKRGVKRGIAEGIIGLWGFLKTPILYAIGAYAAYKTIRYLLNRRKEKKLQQEEIDRLERMRSDLRLNNLGEYQEYEEAA